MNKEKRKCAVCGKTFVPKSANALYCSEKCYKAAKAQRRKAVRTNKAKKAADNPVKGKGAAKKPVPAKAKPIKAKLSESIVVAKAVASKRKAKKPAANGKELEPMVAPLLIAFTALKHALRDVLGEEA